MGRALTVRAIETIKPGPARREIPDGLIRGLYLVVQPSGAQSWAVRYRTLRRESRKLTLGTYPAIGLKDARELASRALVAVASGGDPATTKQLTRTGLAAPVLDRVEQVVDSFIERHVRPNTRPRSAQEAERVLRREVASRWKGRRLSSITRAEVHEMLDEVVDRPAPIMANRLLVVFRTMCSWALERGLIEVSPAERIKQPSLTKTRDRVLTDDELRRIWRAAVSAGYAFGPIVQLLMLTGQRRTEVAEMPWSEVDLNARIWIIPRGRAKNNTENVVPLAQQALEIFRVLPRIGDRFVFTVNGKRSVSGFSKAKLVLDDAILKDGGAAMPHWTFHDLRRTCATGMARLGVNLPVIERVLNHTSGSFAGVVGTYNRHSFNDEKRHALDAWGAFIERLVTEEPSGNVVELRLAGPVS